MSTRTRIIFRFHDGSYQYGGAAVKALINQALPNGFMGAQLPPDWGRMTKRQKLQWLSKDLKFGMSLELYQEPRSTRKKCSMYWHNRIKKQPKPAQPPVNAYAAQEPVVWGRGEQQAQQPAPGEVRRIVGGELDALMRARVPQRPRRPVVPQMPWGFDEGF